MSKIGFKNFRRFIDFESIEHSNITYLVGKNNSGKSTLVKAVLLINSFLKSGRLDYLSFGNDVLNDANIVTYGRAFSQSANESEPLEFKYSLEEYDIVLKVSSDKPNSTVANLIYLDIVDNIRLYKYTFSNDVLTMGKLAEKRGVSQKSTENPITKQIQDLEKVLKGSNLKKSGQEYLKLIDQIQELKQRRTYSDALGEFKEESDNEYEELVEFSGETDFTRTFSLEQPYDDRMSISDALAGFVATAEKVYLYKSSSVQNGNDEDDFTIYRAFYTGLFDINSSIVRFRYLVNQSSQYYLGADNSKQSAFFSIRDKSNALAQAIHDFNLLGVQKGDVADVFLKKWMREFDLGEDYYIKEIEAGEGYIVLIERNGNHIHLADKGMGSVQLMLLLFRIAAIVRLNKGKMKRPLIIAEEPESNLHPALQSKLSELFLEVYEQYRIGFLIETHSEYMIRKSQLLVKEKEFEVAPNKNPFSVIYFDKESMKQWNLEYRADGKFSNDFGEGFYDESRKLVFELL